MTDHNDASEVGYSRPGFLTKKDKAFLKDSPEDLGEYAEKRRRIRQRTRSAFRDFSLLFKYLSERDREMIFEDFVAEDSNFWEETDLKRNIANTFAFACLGLATHWPLMDDREGGHHVREFESVVSEGLKKAYPEIGLILHKVDFDIRSYDKEEVDALEEHLHSMSLMGDPEFTPEIVRTLVAGGNIDKENLREFLSEELELD